jgi:hypothetical protein
MRLVAVLPAVVAACGSPEPAPCADAAVCDGMCIASWTGNFRDGSRAAANCAHLAPELALELQSPVIGSPLVISIDLGAAPSAGMFSSETVATWSAVQARSIGNGACVYSAGDMVVPTGSFTLELASVDGDAPHGHITIVQYVHAVEDTVCGTADTETVDAVF